MVGTKIKDLTAEVAEHAEVEMAKGSGSGCRWEKVRTAKELSRNDLCALRLLFVHPLVFNPGGSKGKEESLSIE
jgi:hypothetical protein